MNSGFGERWDDGREISHPVSLRVYWRDKLMREITRAIATRDIRRLADLVKYSVLLRKRSDETVISSQAMLTLVSGTACVCPRSDALRAIYMEYLSKLPRGKKAEQCKLILRDVCGKIDYNHMLQHRIVMVNTRSRRPDFAIEDLSELRISKDLFRGSDTNRVQQLAIFRADPTADILITPLMEMLETDDWGLLINRVDRIQDDLESWQCLEAFLRSDRMTDDAMDELKEYISSYWPRYHKQIEVPAEVQRHRHNVMQILGF